MLQILKIIKFSSLHGINQQILTNLVSYYFIVDQRSQMRMNVTKKLFILLPLLGLKYAGRMWVSMFCFAIPVPPDNDTKSAKEFTSHHPVEKFYY